jgi:hypothetical protein
MNCQNKYVYVSNKFYKLTEQKKIIRTEQTVRKNKIRKWLHPPAPASPRIAGAIHGRGGTAHLNSMRTVFGQQISLSHN